MTTEKQAFLDKIVPLAQLEAKRSGILASLTIAQAIVESDWGRSILATKGFNFFGIKGDYLGKYIVKNTGEFRNGAAVREDAAFRAYPDIETGFQDHSNFLRRAHYKKIWYQHDYQQACFDVWDAGYATAPDYVSTLLKRIDDYKLTQYDVPLVRHSIEPLPINKGVVQGDNIEGVPFTATIVSPKGVKNVRTGQSLREFKGVTIHNTANLKASAEDHSKWLQSVENADSQYISVHFFVDENSITQTVPINEVCYHAGDGNGDGNHATIAVEICEDGNTAKAEANAKVLAAALLATFPGMLLYKHQDWSGKWCPRVILNRGGWPKFKQDILDLLDTETAAPDPAFLVVVKATTLNIRSTPAVTKTNKVGIIRGGGIYTIVDTDGDWGKLKSGAGWIHLGHTERLD